MRVVVIPRNPTLAQLLEWMLAFNRDRALWCYREDSAALLLMGAKAHREFGPVLITANRKFFTEAELGRSEEMDLSRPLNECFEEMEQKNLRVITAIDPRSSHGPLSVLLFRSREMAEHLHSLVKARK